ncbi:type I restriction-modification system subunit M [Nocardia asteroides]|uniref:type I restriction-modification system subunit M n=1 Tax=Nocardia asteroides TaxID=1824 RepID=UPI003417125E
MTPAQQAAAQHAEARRLADKLWSYCHVLRDAGVPAVDYVEQLTYLLFLKMADERAQLPAALGGMSILPDGITWQTLRRKNGAELDRQYRHVLTELGKKPGMLKVIYGNAENKIKDPALLKRLITDLMDTETWSVKGADVKGDAYEQLLERSVTDQKSGAGQYFTPRALISAIVDCAQPSPEDTVIDPACGTGGFLLAANDYVRQHYSNLTPTQRRRLSDGTTFCGVELVGSTARLAAMNLLLHNMVQASSDSPIGVRDALAAAPTVHASLVLANPPFGTKSTMASLDEEGKSKKKTEHVYSGRSFWVSTTNKQLNFVQHIVSLLKMDGRAAVVLPDNVLFEGGAGEKIRTRLLKECDVHTMLRLPKGIFYAGGVNANVLFFTRKRPDEQPATKRLWVYDFRVGQHFTLKQNPIRREHLQDFVDWYHSADRAAWTASDRARCFTYEELLARDKVNLDLTWLTDPADDEADAALPPSVIAQEIMDDMQAALSEFASVAAALQPSGETL